MVLSEKHLKCIDLIMEDRAYTDIAKILKISRASIYNWLGDKEFKCELDKRKQEIKDKGMSKMVCELDIHLTNIHNLALNSASDNVRLNASAFYIEHVLGKPTTRIEQSIDSDDKTKVKDMEELLKEVDKAINNKRKNNDV